MTVISCIHCIGYYDLLPDKVQNKKHGDKYIMWLLMSIKCIILDMYVGLDAGFIIYWSNKIGENPYS